ncbi:multimeric flavodoxin WrbA [Anaerotaenia torta]|uniref:flavodoxin family protein n=1 Tax=Anaerotaenia torta TaxID=433293 RepID=UPI003D199B20
MKVVAINGSPRPRGNTYTALKTVCDELEKQEIETEILHVGNLEIKGCIGCNRCRGGYCVFSDEELRALVDKIYASDGILLGSPVYYAGIAGTMKSFLDRLFYPNHGRLRLKIGASIAVPRRSGGITTFDQLNNYFLISEMLIAPSYYWNVIHGGAPGEVTQDDEGMSVLRNLANNMSWMLKIKDYSKAVLPEPDPVSRKWTNFIR